MRLPFFKPKAAYSDTSGLDATTARIWVDAFGGTTAKAGVTVDANTALFSNAIAACIAIRSRTLSSLPVHIYKTGTRTKDDKHPSAAMFRSGPNDFLTWAQWMKLREMYVILTGNFYNRKLMKGGRVVGFDPLYGTTTPTVQDGKLSYRFQRLTAPSEPKAAVEVLPASAVAHFKWDVLSGDGTRGRSVVEIAREAIGLDISAEEFLGRFFSNGTHMGTVLMAPGDVSDEQMERLKLQLADGQGVIAAKKARILTNGMTAEVLGSDMKDSEYEETRRFINEKISAICGVPLSLLNDLTHGTYSNVEQMDLSYAKHHITPSIVDLEQTLNKTLFAGADEDKYYVKFSLQALQRGDFLTRMQGYETGIRIGMWSPNECREWEDMDPYDDGDLYVMQAQMTPIEKLLEEPEPVPAPVQVVPSPDENASAALEPVAADAAERIRIRARIDAEKKRDKSATEDWARGILCPIASAYDIAGLQFDTEAVIQSAIGG